MQTMTQQDSMPFLIKNEQITSYGATDGRITAERILILQAQLALLRAPRQSLKDPSWGGKIDKKNLRGKVKQGSFAWYRSPILLRVGWLN